MSVGLFPTPAYAIQDQDACAATHIDETAKVTYVIDGDTVILADDRRVRLIGIDTPEIGHDGRPSDPGAIQARNFLDQILSMQPTVHLIYGHEHFDRHGRTLAHLFLTDNTNVQAALLNKGMATPLTIPPNLQFTDCYQQHAELAIRGKRGLWERPQYQPVPAEKLAGTERGYRTITGKVRRVTESRSSIWINLEKRVALRIQRKDLVYFEGIQLHELAGQRIQARGWVYHRNGELRMQLRHRADLQMTGTIPGN
ncbi:MAG: thermonuclease family protein [Gammaproteobacteria bacterium]